MDSKTEAWERAAEVPLTLAAIVSPEGVAQDMKALRQEVAILRDLLRPNPSPETDQRHTQPAPTHGPGTHPARRTLGACSGLSWCRPHFMAVGHARPDSRRIIMWPPSPAASGS